MIVRSKSIGPLALRLLAALALLGCPRIGWAAGTWSVLPFPVKPGEVSLPTAVAVDAVGNLYVADLAVGIQKRDAEGRWSVIAAVGNGLGQASYYPTALAVDAAGNLYVAEWGNRKIQKRDAQGSWSVIATAGRGLGQVETPSSLAVDTAGNLYVAEWPTNHRIQKRDAQGQWSEIATAGTDSGRSVGEVFLPTAVAVDTAGNLYVGDGHYPNYRIQKRDAQGHWSVIAAQVADALAVDAADNLYVAEWQNNRIRKRDAQGHGSVIATEGDAPGQVIKPWGLAVDTAGNLYVAEGLATQVNANGHPVGVVGNDRVQKRGAQGNWSVIATVGDAPAELLTPPGQGLSPFGVAVDPAGSMYVTDQGRSQILKRDAQGDWSILAREGDAPGQVRSPTALAADRAGTLYIADHFDPTGVGPSDGRIQERDAQGNWSVIATTGTALGQVDNPTALAVDMVGNLYVASFNYQCDYLGICAGTSRIQKRDAQGNWSAIAAEGVNVGQVAGPAGLAMDTAGNLYVADGVNDGRFPPPYRIQKRDSRGNWSAIATEGTDLGQVYGPSGLAVDGAGNLYVADRDASGNVRIQKRDAQGSWSMIETQGVGLNQDPGVSGLAVDTAGNLYVADTGNNRVQVYTPNGGQ